MLNERVVNANSHHSTLRERIVEHLFVGEALRTLWRLGVYDVEVLRSEFDAHGYDVVLCRGGVTRHIQLKTGRTGKPSAVSLPLALGAAPSGCAIWIHVTDALDPGPWFFFGNTPGKPLPSIKSFTTPRRATHNKDGVRPARTNHRLVPGTKFKRIDTLEEVLVELFGPIPGVTIASVVRRMVREGKNNSEIWAAIQSRFKLPPDKKWYPAWYRAEMRRKKLDATA